MKSKYLVIILAFILILCVNTVNAADNSSILSASPDNVLAADESNYDQLKDLIDSGHSVINLDNNYTHTAGDKINVIDIKNKEITINGNNHTINADQSLLFNIENSNVTINNITFVNAMGNTENPLFIMNSNVTLANCVFENCSSSSTNGGVISANNSAIIVDSCIFNENSVTDTRKIFGGGAIYLYESDNARIINSRFKNNHVYDSTPEDKNGSGGAIFIENSSNVFLDNCSFDNNSALFDGGAIFVYKDSGNLTIQNSNFTKNNAFEGGAIKTEGENTYIHNNIFDSNVASNQGGALDAAGGGLLNVTNSLFNNNSAIREGGGAIHTQLMEGGKNYILGCNFTGNSAVEEHFSSCGGAILMNSYYQKRVEGFIEDCNFEDNHARFYGGAISFAGESNPTDYARVDRCNFTGNNAALGSAIDMPDEGSFNFSNIIFGKNKAFDYDYDDPDAFGWFYIQLFNEKNYYPSNVTINVTFNGPDNLFNAIYVENERVDHISVSNITYEVYDGINLYNRTTGSDFVNPKGEDDDYTIDDVWVSYAENAQKLNVWVTPVDKDGNDLDDPIANVTALTDIYGRVSLNLENVPIGKYRVNVKHDDDEYYRYYDANKTFDVVGGLNVTKVTEEYNYTDVGMEMIFVVNITNEDNVPLHNITIIEEVPECFAPNFEAELKGLYVDAYVTVDGNKITYSKELNPNEHIEVHITFHAIKTGIYINNITVTSNETNPVSVQSNRFAVCDPKINFTKRAVNKTVILGDQAVFVINVTNTGDRPLQPWEISVNDYWPEELIYDHIENVTGEWNVIDYFLPVFALNSILEVNESVSFKIYFNTTKIGKFENLANIFLGFGFYEANDTVDVVGRLNVTKVTEESNFTDIGTEMTFVVNITNVNNFTLHNITIIEDVPECFDPNFEAGLSGLYIDTDVTVDGNKITYSKELNPNEHVEIYIKFHAIKNGNYINNITVTSSETAPVSVQSNRFTVYDPKINLTKTAINKTVILGDQAVFVINVTNTGDRPLQPEEISVNDYWPEELIYDHIENVTGEWNVIDSFFPVFALNSILGVNESVSFKIYFNTTKFGKYENRANIFFHLGEIYEANDNVDVVPNVTKSVNASEIDVGQSIEYTIFIDCRGFEKVQIKDALNESFVLDESSISSDWKYEDGVFTYMLQDIPNNLTLKYVVEVTKPGKYINVASIQVYNLPEVTAKAPEVTAYQPNMTVTKTVNDTEILVNESVKYIVTVNNTGDRPLTEIIVLDELNSAFVLDESSISSNWSYDADNSIFTYDGIIDVGENAVLEFVVKITEVGTYTNVVTVSSPGVSDKENKSEETAVKSFIKIDVGNVTAYPGDAIDIPVNVTADGDVPFSGNITVTLPDGSNQTVVIVNGTGNAYWIVPDDFDEGDYLINASYSGDDVYSPSSASGTVSVVPKTSVEISVDNVTAYPGDEVTVSINVTAADGSLFNDNVTITLPDGSNQTVVIVNGTGDVTFNVPEDVGDYTLTVSFEGRDKYAASNATGTVSVIPKTSLKIDVPDITTYPGDDVSVPIVVTADDGTLFNGNVTVSLPDGSNSTVEIVNGTANINVHIPDNAGIYSIDVTFDGDDNYLPSKGSGIVTVKKIPIEISVGNVTAHPGDNINIPVDVTIIGDETSGDLLMITAEIIVVAGNGTLFNGNLTVTLPDGSTQNVEIIDGKGNIAWTIPMGYEGDYPVTASFEGNNIYLSANGTGIITVVKIPTEVSVENITAKPGDNITIPVNLNAEGGVPINGNVTVTLPDGTTKSVEITNGTGETTWTVPGDYAGDYNYSVKYDGNGLYLPSNNTAIITVPSKVPVEIIVGNITAKPGDNVSISVDVLPQDGSLFNGNVTVTLPDGSTKVVEIINGKGSVDWTIPGNYNGTYSLSVTFDGDVTYLPANGTAFITVIPDTPVTPDAPVTPETPENPSVKAEVPMDNKATGNPVIALLMVLALLGIGIKRKN